MLLNVSVRRPISSVERPECSRCVRSPAAIRCAATVMESTGQGASDRNHPPTNETTNAIGAMTSSTRRKRRRVSSTLPGSCPPARYTAASRGKWGTDTRRSGGSGISGRFEDGAAGAGGFQRRAAQWHVVLSDIRRADGDRAGGAEDLKEFIDTSQFGNWLNSASSSMRGGRGFPAIARRRRRFPATTHRPGRGGCGL